MDVKFINPFINATVTVLETMAFVKPVPGRPFLKQDNIAYGDITGIIGITGEKNGTIAVTFDKKSILRIVSNMFQEEMKSVDSEIADAVGELTNMISGQARRELEFIGKVFKAAIPSVVMGKKHSIIHYTSGPKIAIPFSIDKGGFVIEVCMES